MSPLFEEDVVAKDKRPLYEIALDRILSRISKLNKLQHKEVLSWLNEAFTGELAPEARKHVAERLREILFPELTVK